MAAGEHNSIQDQAQQSRRQRSPPSCPPILVRCGRGKVAAPSDDTGCKVVVRITGQGSYFLFRVACRHLVWLYSNFSVRFFIDRLNMCRLLLVFDHLMATILFDLKIFVHIKNNKTIYLRYTMKCWRPRRMTWRRPRRQGTLWPKTGICASSVAHLYPSDIPFI